MRHHGHFQLMSYSPASQRQLKREQFHRMYSLHEPDDNTLRRRKEQNNITIFEFGSEALTE
jgi:hypothetical protein